MMKIFKKPAAFQTFCHNLRTQGTVGFVPTMGALHEGHLSLMQASTRKCDHTVVSIFVNPLQFLPHEDFSQYPRPLKRDLELCRHMNVSAVIIPTPESMYTPPFTLKVTESALSRHFCGQSRPGHFDGVLTVVLKLLNLTQPDVLFMGQKDYQQQLLIRRLIDNLNLNMRLEMVPTLREKSGLAMSSRNQYLLPQQKIDAAGIYTALKAVKAMHKGGVMDSKHLSRALAKQLKFIEGFILDYVAVVDKNTLENPGPHSRGLVALVAGYMGKTRLIDNILL